MKVALMLRLKENDEKQPLSHAVVFRIESNRVVGVENETLPVGNSRQLSIWALSRKISEIYMPEVSEENRKVFSKAGVLVKGKEEMQKNVLFRNYIV